MTMGDKKENKMTGALGEGLAARYLEGKGYDILAKNFKKPWGEIDIVAEKDGILVFVEVKTNSRKFSADFSPELRVDYRKTRHIARAAEVFADSFFSGENGEWRIDIISVVIDEQSKKAKIKHFKNVVTD